MADADRREERTVEPPLDQLPVDQQPIMRPSLHGGADDTDGAPRLPGGMSDTPAIAKQLHDIPIIPPLHTTAPNEQVVPTPGEMPHEEAPPRRRKLRRVRNRGDEFSPLRSDPPPSLMPTWILRSALLALMSLALVITLWTEYTGAADDVRSSSAVIVAHLGVAAGLLAWSYLAMENARLIVPATRYQAHARGWVAVACWTAAFVAPAAAVTGYRALRERLQSSDDAAAVLAMICIVLVTFVLVWLPFRYHARQAARIGAPHTTMIAWFWAPLVAGIGGLLIVAVGLREQLAEGGLTAEDRLIQVGAVYGLPMLVWTLSTWRAVVVFDDVLDIRWRRWKNEWEQTLEDFVAQPPPGPEESPAVKTTQS